MNAKRILPLGVLMLAACGAAAARGYDVTDLADRTGLTERQVRMVLGAPSVYAEYRTSYWIAEHRVMAAMSDPNYYYEDDDAGVVEERLPVASEGVEVEDAAYEDADTAPLDDPDAGQQLRVEDVDDDDGAD